MQQILEYSFARVLVRLFGVVLVILGVRSVISLLSWGIYYFTDESASVGNYSLGALAQSLLPSLLNTALYLGLGIYLARDGHLLARILIAGMHGRCRRCGYDIRSVTSPTCPECNATISADRVPPADPPTQ